MKSRISIGSFLVTLLFFISCNAVSQPEARQGVLDLRNYDIRSEGPLKVKGEWSFFWNRLIDPLSKTDTTAIMVPVPSAWNQLEEVVPGIRSKGYATYQLRILVHPEMENLALRFTEVFSASGYYLNGKNIGLNGLPGTNKFQSVFGYTPTMHVFSVKDYILDLLVHVSNFEHRSGGLRGSVELGTPMQVMSASANRQYRDFFLMGAFLVMGIYFLGMFLTRSELYKLFFALVCLVMFYRILVLSDSMLNRGDWISGISRLRLEYLSFDLLVPLIILMIRFLYPNDFPEKVFRIILWICGLMIVLVIFSPVSLFTQVFPYYMIFVMIASVAVIYVLALAWSRGRTYAPGFAIGIGIAALGAVNDMLFILDVVETGPVSHYTMFLFLLTYALIFAASTSKEVLRNRQISDEILKQNAELVGILHLKDREMEEWSEELAWYREDLQINKQELKKESDLRNRILTILGHDIRAPLGYTKQMVDLLISGDNNAHEKKEMLRLLSGNTHAILTLLENLVYWGTSQTGGLRSRAVQASVKRIVEETVEVYDLPLRDKKIELHLDIPDDMDVFADEDHLKLVLRNLMSNSIKFTKSGGKIRIMGEVDVPGNERRIIIEDNGVGFPPVILKQLLNDEELYSTEGTRKEKGTGIGLKLSKELLDLNKGKMEIESEVGKCTCFTLILPHHSSK